MLTFLELLIGVVVIVGVARYIIKGYSALMNPLMILVKIIKLRWIH
ncbi:hypothetical protein, partial [Enterobacter hormaechei]